MKLYEVLPPGAEIVIVVPLLSVRTRLYVEMLFDTEGATHVMVIVVVPTDMTLTEVGGSGLGGAINNISLGYCISSALTNVRAQDSPSEVDPNRHVHWKLPIVLVQSDVVVLQLCAPQLDGTPVHSLHKSVQTRSCVYPMLHNS